MATPDDFRRIALSFPGAEERSHMRHPDFRVGGRIFATLGSPNAEYGMVSLLPAQQEDFMTLSRAFTPASGAWGRSGSTLVKLSDIDLETLGNALSAAWRKRAPKGLQAAT